MPKPKVVVLDTNVLLDSPQSIYGFSKDTVCVPLEVVRELDTFKKDHSEEGKNSRQVARDLDKLRTQGSLVTGVKLPNGGVLKVIASPESTKSVDAKILDVCLGLKGCTLYTQDINLRLQADAVGVVSQPYSPEKADSTDQFKGYREIFASTEEVNAFYKIGELECPDEDFYPNEYALVKDLSDPSHTALARYDGLLQYLVPLASLPEGGVWGLNPRNMEQRFALDLLLNDDIKLVTLSGVAGTGKTVVAIAAALQKTMEESLYNKVMISRSIVPMGRDVGFLPGELSAKLDPYMASFYDNLEVLMGITGKEKKAGRSYKEILDLGIVSVEALTFIRGRSLPYIYMINDESQNISLHEAKTLLTRMGIGAKLVLLGDPDQIDVPYLDSSSNGLSQVIEAFKDQTISGHVLLTKGERSELATISASIL